MTKKRISRENTAYAKRSATSGTRASRKTAVGSVVDLFCGAGGLTHGFLSEGFSVAAGIDIDDDCRFAYEKNNAAPFLARDVCKLKSDEVDALFAPGHPRVLVGCAPCQPFSTYNQGNEDPKWKLLNEFGRIIREVRPDIVSMENVPQLLKFRNGRVFKKFVRTLEAANYDVAWDVLFCPDYGIPQRRSRLVLLASRYGPIELPQPTHDEANYETVEDAIGGLPDLQAGGADERDPLHCCSRLSPINMRRMKASVPGGTWKDWPKTLVTACHKRETGKGYGSVYGRMTWDEPSPTITTQFFGFGNGRFGHPEQDRALSLREGALLQSFPKDYAFVAPGQAVEIKTIGMLIGNAVPVKLGQSIARAVKAHLEEQP